MEQMIGAASPHQPTDVNVGSCTPSDLDFAEEIKSGVNNRTSSFQERRRKTRKLLKSKNFIPKLLAKRKRERTSVRQARREGIERREREREREREKIGSGN